MEPIKHLSADGEFIYFCSARLDGKYHGVRVSSADVMPILGTGVDPEEFAAIGLPHSIPCDPGDLPTAIADAIRSIQYKHPEAVELIHGRISYEEIKNQLDPERLGG